MTGCYLCKGHGCDDCFEKECNQITPIFERDIRECINCGTPLRLYNTKEVLCRMCPKCVAEEKKIPLVVKQEGGNGLPPTDKSVGIRPTIL